MKQKSVFLFLHGGPGMNSIAEERTLKHLFENQGARIEFWNEPSSLRPNGDPFSAGSEFTKAVESAERKLNSLSVQEGPVQVIGHSFGAHYAMALTHRQFSRPYKISRIHLVAPALNIHRAFKNVMTLAYQDFRASDVGTAEKLATAIEQTRKMGDDAFFEGMNLSLEDPLLMTHYWVNPSRMQDWRQCLASTPGAEFDMNSYLGILKSMTFTHLEGPIDPSIDVHVHWGNQDRISRPDDELETVQRLCKISSQTHMDQAGHFLHLENPELFTNTLLQSSEHLGETIR